MRTTDAKFTVFCLIVVQSSCCDGVPLSCVQLEAVPSATNPQPSVSLHPACCKFMYSIGRTLFLKRNVNCYKSIAFGIPPSVTLQLCSISRTLFLKECQLLYNAKHGFLRRTYTLSNCVPLAYANFEAGLDANIFS